MHACTLCLSEYPFAQPGHLQAAALRLAVLLLQVLRHQVAAAAPARARAHHPARHQAHPAAVAAAHPPQVHHPPALRLQAVAPAVQAALVAAHPHPIHPHHHHLIPHHHHLPVHHQARPHPPVLHPPQVCLTQILVTLW